MANIYGDPDCLEDALNEISYLKQDIAELRRELQSLREHVDYRFDGPREE